MSALSRESYRHGDLHQTLLSAALEMAREGGPDAVVLREATRRAGVSPNAAYRHFADRRAMLLAVSAAAQGMAADSMEKAIAAVPESGDPKVDAREELRAVGLGYLAFAREQPGLFRAAFSVPDDLSNARSEDKAGAQGRSPYGVLGDVLDRLVEVGALPQERRADAELLAWSSVHGLGMLVIDGPLRRLPSEMVANASERLVDMVARGL
ncbi:TetR/AcrR family transcriptional regulator [Glaciihabitans sp. UYNi722]|uniref:TetR/AcrR family transcriptional regulator n=1 Tax=Glaciihabitans sp. UYNi722 TaxID=3156344 RepID=UPI00339B5BE9